MALDKDKIVSMLEDVNNQPPGWRKLADKCADYYDGNQLTQAELVDLNAKDLAPLIVNLIQPTVNVVLGMEEKTRTDWKVAVESANDQETEDLAAALSAKLHEAEVTSKADRACSDAYGGEVKAGLGWVEVGRCSDPAKPQYRVQYVHRAEIDWDWRARQADLSDARWLVRRKWYDRDVVPLMFPDKADLIKNVVGGWSLWDQRLFESTVMDLAQSREDERGFTLEESEWIDRGRGRLCVFEVWYRDYERGHVFKTPSGRMVEFKGENPEHVQALVAGVITPMSAVLERTRVSFWVGPHQLSDNPTPYPHSKFPYVPFFGFREDLTLAPYGLIRAMLSSQDEVNARRSKMYQLLSTRRVTADDDAVLDHQKAANEVARGDAYIILNSKRKQNSAFNVAENGQLAKDQFEVMNDAAENIQKTAGIYQAMLGEGNRSGLANNILIEQGSTTLGEINGNYRDARIDVGNLLLALVIEDIGGNPTDVTVGEGVDKKIVTLNHPDGANIVRQVMAKVTLDNAPSSATYRQQLATQLIEMTKSLPPQVQAVVIPYVIGMSDVANKTEMVRDIRKVLGLGEGPEGQEPEIPPEVMQQMQQMQAGIQQLQSELQAEKDRGLEAKAQIQALAVQKAQIELEKASADPDREKIVTAKLDAAAAQIGRLTQAVAALLQGGDNA